MTRCVNPGAGCWSTWFDLDNKFRSGEDETFGNVISRYPGKICRDPVGVEGRTLSGLTPSEAGDVISGSAEARSDVHVS